PRSSENSGSGWCRDAWQPPPGELLIRAASRAPRDMIPALPHCHNRLGSWFRSLSADEFSPLRIFVVFARLDLLDERLHPRRQRWGDDVAGVPAAPDLSHRLTLLTPIDTDEVALIVGQEGNPVLVPGVAMTADLVAILLGDFLRPQQAKALAEGAHQVGSLTVVPLQQRAQFRRKFHPQ